LNQDNVTPIRKRTLRPTDSPEGCNRMSSLE
jgi:hypothetical protein